LSLRESNPNFDVYNTPDGKNRFIAGKCSRLPDDEDLAAGSTVSIFYRAKPSFTEAQAYYAAMTHPAKILYGLDNYASPPPPGKNTTANQKLGTRFTRMSGAADPQTLLDGSARGHRR